MPYAWGMPSGNRRWHLFRLFGGLSLCGRQRYFADDDDELEDAKQVKPKKHDCRTCVKRYNAIKIEAYR